MKVFTRQSLADTTAAIVFWFVANSMWEVFIARLSWKQIIYARLLGPIFYLPVGWLYGRYRNWLMQLIGGTKSRVRWLLVVTFCFATFEGAYYVFLLRLVVHANWWQVIASVSSLSVFTIGLGWTYDIWLNYVRYKFSANENSP